MKKAISIGSLLGIGLGPAESLLLIGEYVRLLT